MRQSDIERIARARYEAWLVRNERPIEGQWEGMNPTSKREYIADTKAVIEALQALPTDS